MLRKAPVKAKIEPSIIICCKRIRKPRDALIFSYLGAVFVINTLNEDRVQTFGQRVTIDPSRKQIRLSNTTTWVLVLKVTYGISNFK